MENSSKIVLGPAANTLPEADEHNPSYANKLTDSLYWWLSSKKPFIINDQYKIELLHLDRYYHSAKIRITNLTTNEVTTSEMPTNEG